jgi:indole-3-glycerol phosphate synthase/phosphoribosylanthranilate isomerase
MTDVLAELVEATRSRLAARRAGGHRFAAALSRPGPRFILELKRASPSEGVLRDPYDPAAIAVGYAGIADAVSVVTAEHRFGGSLEHLRAVRERITEPLLCKDFFLDPGQVVEAGRYGADAVLLMLSILDDRSWRACADTAASLGMDALTEVHGAGELARAIALGAPIIGINSRDLRTLRVDLAVVERLAPDVPPDRIVVAESGVRSRADVTRLARHVDAFLVGGSLMRSPEPAVAARELVHGRVKICGLTSADDARLAWAAGAAFGGLVFASMSPRVVTERRALEIAAATPMPLAGVFVDEDAGRIARLAASAGLAAVQLHGEETREEVAALRGMLPRGCQIWKGVRMREETVVPPLEETGADRLVLDGYRQGRHGGTGTAFAWDRIPEGAIRDRIILAGGITPENAAAAARLGCWGLDVASATESAPGVKDPERMGRLFAALRAAA